MKKINVIVLLSLLATYLIYGLFTESWTKNDFIQLIALLAGGLINSVVVAGNRGK